MRLSHAGSFAHGDTRKPFLPNLSPSFNRRSATARRRGITVPFRLTDRSARGLIGGTDLSLFFTRNPLNVHPIYDPCA